MDTNPRVKLDISDSIFNDGSYLKDEEYCRYIDERINVKLAEGMKRVAALVLTKFDSLLKDKIKLLVKQEMLEIESKMDKKYQSLHESLSQQNLKSTKTERKIASTPKLVELDDLYKSSGRMGSPEKKRHAATRSTLGAKPIMSTDKRYQSNAKKRQQSPDKVREAANRGKDYTYRPIADAKTGEDGRSSDPISEIVDGDLLGKTEVDQRAGACRPETP